MVVFPISAATSAFAAGVVAGYNWAKSQDS